MMQGVIFDMDGLMFDTEPIWGACWEPVLAEFGLAMPKGLPDAVRGCAGQTMHAALRDLLGDGAPVEDIWAREKEVAQERLTSGVPKKPGLDDLLEYLRDWGTPMAVASSSSKPVIQANLASGGVAGFFDVVVSGESLERSKPDPLIFQTTAELLGTDPARTLVLEDSFNGVEAAWRGGFVTVMVPDLQQPTERVRAMTRFVVGDLGEIIDLLESGQLG